MKILLLSGIFFIALHSFGNSASECYYMPFNCDFKQSVKSTMTIDFVSEKPHSPMPFKTVISEHDRTDEWHAVWEIFIDAVSKDDPQILSSFFAKEDSTVNTPPKILNWYHKNYTKMELLPSRIELVRCINGDDQKKFLWGAKKNDKYIIAGELFFKVANRIFWQWAFGLFYLGVAFPRQYGGGSDSHSLCMVVTEEFIRKGNVQGNVDSVT